MGVFDNKIGWVREVVFFVTSYHVMLDSFAFRLWCEKVRLVTQPCHLAAFTLRIVSSCDTLIICLVNRHCGVLQVLLCFFNW